MSTYTETYSLCSDSTNTTTDIDTYFVITAKKATIKYMEVAMKCTKSGGGYYTLGIKVNGTTVESHQLTVPQLNKTFVGTNFNVEVQEGDVIQITRSSFSSSTSYYYGALLDNFNWGFTGQRANTQINCSEMNITIEIENDWEINNNENIGYMKLVNIPAIDFTEFTKDAYGYPTNWGVWKFDNQNEGYPWITGYKEYKPKYYISYIINNQNLQSLGPYVKKQQGLSATNIFKEGDN